MNKLSKREKVLIYILLIIAIIIVGWYFLIAPTLEKNTKLKNKADDLSYQYQTKKAIYESNIDIAAETKKTNEELAIYQEQFMDLMSDNEVDKYFTELSLQYQLTPVDLTINQPSETEVISFAEAVAAANEKTNSSTTTNSSTSSDTSTEDKKKSSSPTVLVAVIQQRVSGTPTKVANYLDKLKGVIGIAVNKLQYSYSETPEEEFTTITYNLYMIEK